MPYYYSCQGTHEPGTDDRRKDCGFRGPDRDTYEEADADGAQHNAETGNDHGGHVRDTSRDYSSEDYRGEQFW